ncbi:lactose/cellobiose-specific phosphotransferase system IIC component [Mycoplasmoides fastidiosum]|uniref:PTS system lactose-specific EIICB component n=1 Tax=Mycoplasmoides fastidiosum TaxID=92758 RepID=A0ABU0LYR9_9BACT|nr:PTS transporter subunit EIIC [Mycoplasmoides fastidiosum]MDQ0513861.1 lactose/cellobiose-specific phosphotransferase system IIC component [Mycoplasmoides fastidiosum]UUD37725.1 PTS transporter subunit EIIC [Mycoplasmoides fastidiosum]
MNPVITKQQFRQYAKTSANYLNRWLTRFTSNLLIKSLMQAMIQTIMFIIVGALFLLLFALPQAILTIAYDADYLNEHIFNNYHWNNWSRFTLTVWDLSGGFLGILVAAQLGYVMTKNLNPRLNFQKQIPAIFVYITCLISYIILAIIPASIDAYQVGDNSYSRFAVLWGSQGLLPGIILGWCLPLIFYLCYKHNITLRLSPSAPQIISRAFTPIVPVFISFFLVSSISLGFNILLGAPLFIWIFTQLSSRIINQINDTWGLAIFYSFIKPFSWFIGIQPNWTGAIFQPILLSNLTENGNLLTNPNSTSLYSWSNGRTHIFVENVIDSFSDAGGAGATFMVPFLYLLFAKSDQLKTVGKNSSVTIWLQVNEPLLFGAGLILNPIYVIPFLLTPILSVIPVMTFWQLGLFNGAGSNLPWPTPWFLRTAIPNFNQVGVYFSIIIGFLLQIFMYLPFIKIHDNILLKQEKLVNPNKLYVSGLQVIWGTWFNFDPLAFKQLRLAKKTQKDQNNSADQLQQTFVKKHNDNINFYSSVKLNKKLEKLNKKLENKIQLLNDKHTAWIEKQRTKIETLQQKVEIYQNDILTIAGQLNAKQQAKIDKWNAEITNLNTQQFSFKLTQDNEPILWYFRKKMELELKYQIYQLRNENYLPIRFYFAGKIYNHFKNPNYQVSTDVIATLESEKNNNLITKVNLSNQIIHISQTQNPYQNYLEWIHPSKSQTIMSEIIENKPTNSTSKKPVKKILCLCIGAGSSSVLANNLNKAAQQHHLNYEATAFAFGNHAEAFKLADIVLVSPQLKPNYQALANEGSKDQIKVVQMSAKEYINLSNDVNAVTAYFEANSDLLKE